MHIADVTYFVRPGTLTDREAQERSTTIYLADRRYDMLPGVLSANLCSLVSGRDRSVMFPLVCDGSFCNIFLWSLKELAFSKYVSSGRYIKSTLKQKFMVSMSLAYIELKTHISWAVIRRKECTKPLQVCLLPTAASLMIAIEHFEQYNISADITWMARS